MRSMAWLWPLTWRKFIHGLTNETSPFEQIAAVEQVPNYLSYGFLKLQPIWDSLRGDPKFEEIVASLAPKESTPQ